MTDKVSMEPYVYIRKDQLHKAMKSAAICEVTSWPGENRVGIFTTDQLAEARREERERCAKVCEERMAYFSRGVAEQYEAENRAAAIRALKD